LKRKYNDSAKLMCVTDGKNFDMQEIIAVTDNGQRVKMATTKRSTRMSDGRELIYFDETGSNLPAERKKDLREPAPRPAVAEMRLDSLTGSQSPPHVTIEHSCRRRTCAHSAQPRMNTSLKFQTTLMWPCSKIRALRLAQTLPTSMMRTMQWFRI
jgi:hypothetical protein